MPGADQGPFVLVSVPDLLRLLTLPAFAWIALQDVRTRRVPNRTWYPLAGLGVVLLVWEGVALFAGDAAGVSRQRFLVQVLLSLGFVIPLAYGFWLVGGFGGADAKAFFTVAVLFPTYPDLNLWELGVQGAVADLPIVVTTIGVFSLTVLSNTVIAGVAYPLLLAVRNAVSGYVSPGMFVARPVPADEAVDHYGSMLEFPDRPVTDDLSPSGLRGYFSWRGLDLDALRMYLQWRGADLSTLRADPGRYRDPETLPDEPNPPGDGSMATDGGEPADGSTDPWGARAFLEAVDHSAYGTNSDVLREGLDSLVEDDVVWISPGIPFLVPLFFGLVLSFTVGDVLFALMHAVGFA
jgi:preflagellin peptidase FlaK